ncbi:snurportin-1 [Vespa crabro]|uniref:snurportin-1 n=1 Tax=Vespa crabro TaxID=7445 RepID=UPI001EFF9E5D|nr:snurportin-1 [Vespa crabro]
MTDNNIRNIEEKQCKNARSVFYKKPIKKDNYKLDVDYIDSPQELRRQRLLEIQKRNRDVTFNAGREILEIFNSDNENEEEMEIEYNNKPWKKYERCKHYANQFMLSEWMFEAPQDILEKWIIVPCPQGKRTLIVARKNTTKVFNRRGNRLGKFQSVLPGGNSNEHHSRCTILDCIWMEKEKTYFVLDVLAWSNQSLLNCDTEFRFFWLKSKFQEKKELQEGGIFNNTYPILLLPRIYFDSNLESGLANLSALAPLDGLLFYHRDGLYTRGHTPLVTWLKTFMLPEILGISLPPPFDEKPDDYIDIRHYLLNFKARKHKEEGAALTNNMEIVDEDVEVT